MVQINSLAHANSKNVLFIKFLPYSIGQVKILTYTNPPTYGTDQLIRSCQGIMTLFVIQYVYCIVWCLQEYGSPPIYNPWISVRAHARAQIFSREIQSFPAQKIYVIAKKTKNTKFYLPSQVKFQESQFEPPQL